jgi:hypothetical protein
MKFISLDKLLGDARRTLLRFPFVLLAGAFACGAIISRTDDSHYLMVGFLGISLQFALALIAERKQWNKSIAGIVGIALLLLYFFTTPDIDDATDQIRFLVFLTGSHLLAAFAPYIVRNEINGFWQYNKTLFIRTLAAALFTGVLYAGLALALLAIDNLFNIEIDEDIYTDLAAILFCIFATWFFLAGVPSDFEELEKVDSYPNALKIFTQYVLLSLVGVYLIILYFYTGKILITWEWPIGWVSSLILGLAVAGILSLLLLYPIRNREGNRWIASFDRWYYRALLPLIVLLFLAIGRRISDYGFTESRYFVFGLSIWLAGVALYFVISRRDNIKVVPISLFAITVLSSFGPWGAFDVSVQSQTTRLRTLLEEKGLLVDGKVHPANDTLDREVEGRVHSIINFLDDRNRLDDLRSWYPDTLKSLDRYTAMTSLGFQTWASASGRDAGEHFYVEAMDRNAFEIGGYDYAVRWEGAYAPSEGVRFALPIGTITAQLDSSGSRLLVMRNDTLMASFDLRSYVDHLNDSLSKIGGTANNEEFAPNNPEEVKEAAREPKRVAPRPEGRSLPYSTLSMTQRGPQGGVKVYFPQIRAFIHPDMTRVESLDAIILIDMLPPAAE